MPDALAKHFKMSKKAKLISRKGAETQSKKKDIYLLFFHASFMKK
tara:strand:+ start:132 stop:266 length:135 start_codon:yes stop_codon:yes gene_type:complete